MSIYTLRNAVGVEVRIARYGGIILSLRTPDRGGALGDVVLGYDSVDEYRDNPAYLGALIGRYANRIAHGRFTLDGETYTLTTNEPPHHLHGGRHGFDSVRWDAEPLPDGDADGLALRYVSADGEEGYPGRVEVRVQYTLTDGDPVAGGSNDAGRLVVDYHATTDRATPVSLTQHSYFNLAGHGAGDVLGHVLTVATDRFTPVDETLIPTGELRDVAGTPFDFRRPTAVGARIDEEDEQLRHGCGYDHNYVLGGPGDGPGFAARVWEPTTGRTLEVRTTEPGLQLYTGNHLDENRGKGGVRYGAHAGLALETQQFPDSPNQPSFPSTIVRPGAPYRSRTVFAFGVADDVPGGQSPPGGADT